MSHPYLQDFIALKEEREFGVKGIVVRQHGRIVDSHDFVEPERVQLFSASKTFTSIAAGIAMGEGYFSLHDRMVDLIPELLPDTLPEGYDQLTVWHLLTMTTGHDTCPIFKMQARRREEALARGEEFPRPGESAKIERRRGDMSDFWFEAFMSEPLTKKTGEYYVYNNGATYLVSIITQAKVGMPIDEYLKPRLFDPLGIKNVHWDKDKDGRCLGAIGLHLTTEELSRGAQVLLDGGRWEGRQLIPEDYVNAMMSRQADTAPTNTDPEGKNGYGYQMWLCTKTGAARMDGMFGQIAIVIPQLDAVVAFTSHHTGNTCDIIRAVWDTLWDKLEASK